MKTRMVKILLLALAALFLLACGFGGATATQQLPATTATQGVVQATTEALVDTLAPTPTKKLAFPSSTPKPTKTDAKSLPTLTPMPTFETPTETPTATITPTIADMPPVSETPVFTTKPTNPGGTPEPTQALSDVELKEKIAAANVLVCDDSGKNGILVQRVDKALANLGINNVTNTLDAYGNFYTLLKSDNIYDLVIVVTEDRNGVRLGVWDAVKTRVDAGAALIVENWYLNEMSIGQITPLLEECGIDVDKNWERPNPYKEYLYAIYPVETSSPVLQNPNLVEFPLRPHIFWEFGDVGDLLKITNPDTAKILAGIYTADGSKGGLITSCLNDRVIFQTFSTHDYDREVTIKLWENYIVNTLSSHFKLMP